MDERTGREDETSRQTVRDMSRLFDVMTAVEMDDDPLILINPLRYATMALRVTGTGTGASQAIYNLNARLAQSGTRCFI